MLFSALAVISLSLSSILNIDAHTDACCAPTTKAACRATAISQGLHLGGGGYDFAGHYTIKGCYAYSGGQYSGMAFWGKGGTDEEEQDQALGYDENKYRPIPCGCAPTTEAACRATAISQGLHLGGGGYNFAGHYTIKGCYAYSGGEYSGMAFWGAGGTDEEEQDQALGGDCDENKYRPIPCAGCRDSPLNWYDCDGKTYNCQWYAEGARRCEEYGHDYENFGKVANEACVACGGGECS